MNEPLTERVKLFVAKETRFPVRKMSLETRLQQDMGVDGDDAEELIFAFAVEFDVDMTGFQWARHFHSEAFLSSWLFTLLHRELVEPADVPVTVQDLVTAAETRKWRPIVP
jgi:uncharacterized protein DUF1493